MNLRACSLLASWSAKTSNVHLSTSCKNKTNKPTSPRLTFGNVPRTLINAKPFWHTRVEKASLSQLGDCGRGTFSSKTVISRITTYKKNLISIKVTMHTHLKSRCDLKNSPIAEKKVPLMSWSQQAGRSVRPYLTSFCTFCLWNHQHTISLLTLLLIWRNMWMCENRCHLTLQPSQSFFVFCCQHHHPKTKTYRFKYLAMGKR